MSSSLLIRALTNAGIEADLNIEVIATHSFGTSNWDFEKFPADVVLIAPQIRFLKKGIEKIASAHGIPVVIIEPTTYGMADGDRLLQQVMRAIKNTPPNIEEFRANSGD